MLRVARDPTNQLNEASGPNAAPGEFHHPFFQCNTQVCVILCPAIFGYLSGCPRLLDSAEPQCPGIKRPDTVEPSFEWCVVDRQIDLDEDNVAADFYGVGGICVL